jgi:hypothetical protein
MGEEKWWARFPTLSFLDLMCLDSFLSFHGTCKSAKYLMMWYFS